jgi:hypothetical protein
VVRTALPLHVAVRHDGLIDMRKWFTRESENAWGRKPTVYRDIIEEVGIWKPIRIVAERVLFDEAERLVEAHNNGL